MGIFKKKYGIPPASTQGLMEEILNEAQLLKEDPQLIKRVMEAMRKKLDLCLRRDGGTCGGDWEGYQASKKRTFCYFYVAIILYWRNVPKNVGKKLLTVNVLLIITHVNQKFYDISLKSHCSATVDQFHLKISSMMNQR